MATTSKSHKNKGKAEEVFVVSISFEGVAGIKCRHWWQGIDDQHALKVALRKVDKIVFMPMLP